MIQTLTKKILNDLVLSKDDLRKLKTKVFSQFFNLETEPEIPCFLSCSIVSDEEIHKINLDYRGKDKPTDVLSFSSLESSSGMPKGEGLITPFVNLGDIVLSYDTLVRQASEYGHSRGQEFLRLYTHGVLHLLGFDHENVSEEVYLEMVHYENVLKAELISFQEQLNRYL